ncbi:hypothetical protein BDW59DRAFT_174417 [Aspergillus cavernicola]|uniref:Myb-like domain-containing protein n=1 Tax=Aspergillus cavernicola TaxID=176166 RepID=A0ABR4HZB6_9EURO
MYNPWSAHTHGHHTHHAHAHHAQHGHTHAGHTTTPTLSSVSTGTPVSLPASSRMDLDSSYQMSQMRWLPSMITTRSGHGHSSLPTISSGLRHSNHHPQQQQQQQQGHAQGQTPASVIVESRAPAPAGLVNPGATQQVQAQVQGVESTMSGTRDMGGADALGEVEFTGEGHRLTTKEEVSLFEICNRHAGEFGRRSNLCKWWMTVTMEFTRGQKHPYSWHSVRRKFLQEQRDKGPSEADDLSNPRWRAVAEAARIEKRDSRRPRKRKWTITTPTTTTITTDGGAWDLPGSSAPVPSTGPDPWRAPSSSSGSPMLNHTQPPQHNHVAPAPSATPISISSTPVRLPPGFDTMFSSTQSQTPSTPFNIPNANANANLHAHHSNQQHPSPSTTSPTNQPTDNTMMAAVLETLGKLNKHLDSTSNPTASTSPSNLNPLPIPLPNPEPLSSSQSNSHTHTQDSSMTSGISGIGSDEIQSPLSTTSLSTLREQLKREMLDDLRTEWDKERAVLEEKLDSVQRTQEMILEMLRQEPS